VKPRPPVSVYKDTAGVSTWRWTCHVPYCVAHDWHGRRQDAQDSALAHLKGHATFGFRRP
jgi:hypothetical protein